MLSRKNYRAEEKETKLRNISPIRTKLPTNSKTYRIICPFCSSRDTFDQKKMRCKKCGTIVNQVKDYELIETRRLLKNIGGYG